MNSFSIAQMEQFSGIKAHTIRIWEKRYKALKPRRSEGNTRYYDNSQLRRLLNIASMMGEYKISDLCAMPDQELFRIVKQKLDMQGDSLENFFIRQLISAALNFQEQAFNSLFSQCLIRYGMKDTYTRVIYPLLFQTGMLWSCNAVQPASEHFISNLIRQKIMTAIELLPGPSDNETWVLFLPEGEFHDIGLLLAYYLLKNAGKKVIFLGSNTPQDSLAETLKQVKPDHLLFFAVHRELPGRLEKYIDGLHKSFRGKRIYVAAAEGLKQSQGSHKKLEWLHSVEDLEKLL